MKKLAIVFVLVSSLSFSQKIELGVSYDVGINFTGKDRTIQQLYEFQSYPTESHLIRPHSIWTTHQIQFDVYPTQIRGFSASLGLRMFTFGWETDSVSAGYVTIPPGGGMTFYGRRESQFGYFTPTIGISYQHTLYQRFKLKYAVSFGMFGFMDKRKQYSFTYDPSGENQFEIEDDYLREWTFYSGFYADVHDLQISSECVYSFKGFSLSVGPALYYLTSDFVDHLSFQVKAGAIYRFSRKEN